MTYEKKIKKWILYFVVIALILGLIVLFWCLFIVYLWADREWNIDKVIFPWKVYNYWNYRLEPRGAIGQWIFEGINGNISWECTVFSSNYTRRTVVLSVLPSLIGFVFSLVCTTCIVIFIVSIIALVRYMYLKRVGFFSRK